MKTVTVIILLGLCAILGVANGYPGGEEENLLSKLVDLMAQVQDDVEFNAAIQALVHAAAPDPRVHHRFPGWRPGGK